MKKHNKLMIDFQRLLETQEFKSEEELRKFMDNLVGQKIPSFPKEILNSKEQAQDLIYEVYELPVTKGIKQVKKALELNPNDNQGVRDQLLLYLIELGENKKFVKYSKKYKHDNGAFALFTRTLFTFKTEGQTEKANEQLKTALSKNKYVAAKLISNKPAFDLPESYGFGDANEAKYYSFYAQTIWQQTDGAIEWLKRTSK